MPGSFDTLKGISDISQSTLCDQLESNLITWFNWGLLNIGAFGTSRLAGSGAYGGDMSRLRPVNDPNYIPGQVWEGFRQDWVWESGIHYSVQPIQVSGVWVNGSFYPVGTTGQYSHKVNYPMGRIIFDNPIAYTGANVIQAEFSYRYFTFQSSDEKWFREVMYESFRIDDSQFLQYGSGVYNVLAEQRVQLPAVIVDVIPRRTMVGYQLGGGQYVYQDVLFHMFSETPYDRKTMMDVITYQKDKTIPLFDKNAIAQKNDWPLDWYGSLASGAKTYPDLAKPTGQGGYYWRYATFDNVNTQETISAPPLYQAVVRATVKVNMIDL